MVQGIYAAIPNRRQLRHWEQVCRYLESQPLRSVRHPLPVEPPMSVRLFKRMARFKLIRHVDIDCTWRVTRHWEAILRRLWLHLPDEVAPEEPVHIDTDPFIVDAGPDTMYVSLLVPPVLDVRDKDDPLRWLPAGLNVICGQLKEAAQAEDEPVETPWQMFDAPLSMQKSGVGTKSKGKGVSWSYLLRNDFVMIRLRKRPLDRLIGSIRFSARTLWTQGATESLDAAKVLIQQMWQCRAGSGALTWQLSQLHLCVDVANFAPTAADVERVVSHSRKRAFHIPSTEDEAASFPSDEVYDEDFDPGEYEQPFGWDDVDLEDEDWPDDEEDAEKDTDEASDDASVEDDEELVVDEQRISGHLYGGRLSGFHFSPGAPLSSAWYDKELEERMSGKTWMKEIHEACGWKPAMRLFRVEARFGRELLHEIGNTLPENEPNWCDDPWLAIQHMNDFWGYYAGLPPEADRAPDVTHRGWLRLVIPQGEDSVKSRWPTDPAWLVIQRADLGQIRPQVPLRRKHVPMHDPDAIDAVIYGLMVLRSVLHGRQGERKLGLDDELVEFMLKMEEWDQKRQRRYAEEVREKARKAGLPVPMQESPIWEQWETD